MKDVLWGRIFPSRNFSRYINQLHCSWPLCFALPSLPSWYTGPQTFPSFVAILLTQSRAIKALFIFESLPQPSMISWLVSIIQSFGKYIVECFITVPFEGHQNETSSSRALLEDFSNEFNSTSSYDMLTLSSPAPPSTAPIEIPIVSNLRKINFSDMAYLNDRKDDPMDVEMVKVDCSSSYICGSEFPIDNDDDLGEWLDDTMVTLFPSPPCSLPTSPEDQAYIKELDQEPISIPSTSFWAQRPVDWPPHKPPMLRPLPIKMKHIYIPCLYRKTVYKNALSLIHLDDYDFPFIVWEMVFWHLRDSRRRWLTARI
jgi:hypothetical protein